MTLLPVCKAQRVPAASETRPIVIGEALEMKVAGEPELSNMVVVPPDGRIALPLLNGVQAAGLTIRAAGGAGGEAEAVRKPA
jgi:protein involved in polysaccharide export with SLBB domain